MVHLAADFWMAVDVDDFLLLRLLGLPLKILFLFPGGMAVMSNIPVSGIEYEIPSS